MFSKVLSETGKSMGRNCLKFLIIARVNESTINDDMKKLYCHSPKMLT